MFLPLLRAAVTASSPVPVPADALAAVIALSHVLLPDALAAVIALSHVLLPAALAAVTAAPLVPDAVAGLVPSSGSVVDSLAEVCQEEPVNQGSAGVWLRSPTRVLRHRTFCELVRDRQHQVLPFPVGCFLDMSFSE